MRGALRLVGVGIVSSLLCAAAFAQQHLTADEMSAVVKACQQAKAADQKALCTGAVQKLKGSASAASGGPVRIASVTSLPLSFRGIPIGVPNQRAALESLCRETAKRKEYCSEITPDQDKHLVDFQFGNLHVPLLDTRIGADGAVNFIKGYGRNDELIQLASLLAEKFGEPKKDLSTVHTRIGASYEKLSFSWIDERGNVLVVETRSVSVDSGHFMFASAAEMGKKTGEAAAVREALKGKL
ncbi:MAG: hypothetical protein JNK92_02010 [Dechloromonas sp.]|nr:hypothetical protein [Dechloromonas sp.]